jgi:catalase
LQNGPGSFEGRKIGVLVTDGSNIELLDALTEAAIEEGATVEVIAPTVGGIEASDGTQVKGHEKIGGGPSVLYDAVAILPSKDGASQIAKDPASRDFAADAFAHLKFIAYVDAALPLLEKAGISKDLDQGCIQLATSGDASGFIAACRALRHWEREKTLK